MRYSYSPKRPTYNSAWGMITVKSTMEGKLVLDIPRRNEHPLEEGPYQADPARLPRLASVCTYRKQGKGNLVREKQNEQKSFL